MNVAVSIGGSLIATDDVPSLRQLGDLLSRAADDHALYLVVGGGAPARRYIQAGRALGASEATLDELGIAATRLNAMLVAAAMDSKPDIPATIEAAAAMPPPVVMGGTTPGHSTDAVGARLARQVNAARFVIATDVDGVYSDDPKSHPDATRYDRISIEELRGMTSGGWEQAGTSAPVDGVACRVIEEAAIPTAVVNGANLSALENAIYGRPFYGTQIEV